tara:strand:+ start:766 stop:1197 length:432 start_codon:yes stop_codon:yes gene_type:complete
VLLEPIQDYFALLNEGYLIVIIAVSIALVSIITYRDRQAKVSKIVLLSVLSITLVPFLLSFMFLGFLGYQHVFAHSYEYLQLSVSIFLIFLTLLVGMFVNAAILDHQPFNFIFVFLSLIVLVIMGAIGPVVFVLARLIWSVIL